MNKGINNNGYDYVDLGLPSGTLWATCNVKAKNPSDSGLYFQWGNIVGYMANEVGKDKQFNWSDYKWYLNGNDYDNNVKFKKYTTTGATLDLEDDAAHANMGGSWHMPTPEQIQELIDDTTSAWTTLDGVKGMTFTSNKDESKSIFIPVVGGAWGGSVHGSGRYGLIWSSMLDAGSVRFGRGLGFGSGGVVLVGSSRFDGLSVRGVIDKSNDNFKNKKNDMEINNDLNLVEILKDAPKGTKLWSPICGECELDNINSNVSYYPIECISKNLEGNSRTVVFTTNGKSSYFFANGECVLFPSKENRDWSTFKIPKKHKVFRTYQKVLVKELVGKNFDKLVWLADEYSHYDEDSKQHYCTRAYGFDDDEIIPYEGNEDKVGKTVEKWKR